MKEGEMLQIPVRRAFVKGALLALVTLGVGSCNHRCDCARILNLHPNDKPLDTIKKQKLVPCDTKITADINTGGVDLDAAFLCENDTVTWQIQNRHSFHVKFDNGSPFQHGKSDFTENDASGTVKGQYDKLEVYKYTITVDSKKPVDPQVIGGGNP
jgi:hypothetical protein